MELVVNYRYGNFQMTKEEKYKKQVDELYRLAYTYSKGRLKIMGVTAKQNPVLFSAFVDEFIASFRNLL